MMDDYDKLQMLVRQKRCDFNLDCWRDDAGCDFFEITVKDHMAGNTYSAKSGNPSLSARIVLDQIEATDMAKPATA